MVITESETTLLHPRTARLAVAPTPLFNALPHSASPPSVQVGMTMLSAYLSVFDQGRTAQAARFHEPARLHYIISGQPWHNQRPCTCEIHTETRVVSYTLYIKKYYTTRYILVPQRVRCPTGLAIPKQPPPGADRRLFTFSFAPAPGGGVP